MARGDLTDAQWEELERHLPTNKGKRGHPYRDHRQVINGILWIQRTGAPWEDLPERYGPPTTCNDRLIRWKKDGTWERILQALQREADAEGEIEWEGCALDGSSVKAHPHAAGARKFSPARAKRGRRRERACGVLSSRRSPWPGGTRRSSGTRGNG